MLKFKNLFFPIHTQTYAHIMHTLVHTCAHTPHTHIHTHVHTHSHTHTNMHTHIYTRTHTHTYIHTYIHTHTYTHTNMHTHKHTQPLFQLPLTHGHVGSFPRHLWIPFTQRWKPWTPSMFTSQSARRHWRRTPPRCECYIITVIP